VTEYDYEFIESQVVLDSRRAESTISPKGQICFGFSLGPVAPS